MQGLEISAITLNFVMQILQTLWCSIYEYLLWFYFVLRSSNNCCSEPVRRKHCHFSNKNLICQNSKDPLNSCTVPQTLTFGFHLISSDAHQFGMDVQECKILKWWCFWKHCHHDMLCRKLFMKKNVTLKSCLLCKNISCLATITIHF